VTSWGIALSLQPMSTVFKDFHVGYISHIVKSINEKKNGQMPPLRGTRTFKKADLIMNDVS
jgi:hypothetical protein